jgi:threonine/homoserine/homoserine lactone efflux protein
MTIYGLALFSLVYALAVATPGPGVAAVVARSLVRGTRGAPAFIAGFVIGDLVWFTVAVTGLAALAQAASAVFAAVKYAGAAYLLYLAWRMWTTRAIGSSIGDDRHVETTSQRPSRLFAGSLALTLGNPKTMVFFLALLPTVVELDRLNAAGFAEIAAIIVVVLPTVLGTYVLAAARARRMLRNARAVQIVNRTGASMMAGAAIAVARS